MLQILELIRTHDGKWSWYQLERMLAGQEISRSGQLMSILKNLEDRDLIKSSNVPGYPNPLYSITENGMAYLTEHGGGAEVSDA